MCGIIVTRHLGGAASLQIPESKTVVKSSFSTGEVDTGKKWIDGKAIYRRCASGTTLASLTSAIGTISGIDKVLSLQVMSKTSGDGGWRPIPWLFNIVSSPDWFGGVYITSAGAVTFQVGASIGSTSQSVAIVEYTKT